MRTPTSPAQLPPTGLPGLDPEWSRIVDIADADGVARSFHVLESGVGEPSIGTILCVHGNPTWSYLWRALVAAPPRGWRVIAVDQLGMGYSERIGEVRRLAQRIDDLGRLTDALGITGPVVTVAHDWGGPVSLGWALDHQDQLAGVVLTNTAVHQPEGARAPTLIRIARSAGLRQAVCRDTATFVRGTTALSRPRPAKAVRDAFAAPYASAARRQAVADFVADIPLEDDHPSMATLRAIADGVRGLTVPVLLAWGPADPVFSDLYLRDLIERIPHADVHRYEGASHLVTEDAPAALADISRWIESTCDPRRADAATLPRRVEPTPTTRLPMTAALTARAADPRTAAEPAIVELSGSGRTITWGHLDRVVTDVARGLARAGVQRGDRVVLLVPPGADLAAAVYACWRIGAVVVVADAGLGLRGLTRALRGAWPDYIIAAERGLVAARLLGIGGRRFAVGSLTPGRARRLGAEATLAELARNAAGTAHDLQPPQSDDVAAVVFTSGATGPAKGVVYRHGQVEANRDALVELYGIDSRDRLVAAFAPFALYGPAMGIASAVPDMDVTRPATLTAAHLADAVTAVAATIVWASPAALRTVLATQAELSGSQRTGLSRVRLVMSAGAPVPRSLLHELGPLLPQAQAHTPYGMTEVLPVADADLTELDKAGDGDGVCVGRPVPGALVAISALNPQGNPVGELDDTPGVVGEIVVAAPWVKDSYDRLWATQDRSARDGGEWHRTGDVGFFDAEGRLWVAGRLAHVITTAAGPMAPVGPEQRAEAIDGISMAACVGVGPAGAQVVAMVVVPVSGAAVGDQLTLADDSLAAAVRAAVGPVAAVLTTGRLPVDIRHNSKIDRTELARRVGDFLS